MNKLIHPTRRNVVLALAGAGLLSVNAAQSAQWPTKPVTCVVSFPPGSGADTMARFYARRLQEVTKQTFVVENRPGANSFLAAQAVARAEADGYTLFFSSGSPMTTNVVLFKNVPYDPVKDFSPVARTARATNGIVVAANSPIKSIAELVAAGKKAPKALSYASGSSVYRIATEWFSQTVGIEALHVPYKGAAPALLDVASGQADFAIADISAVLPLARGGKLRVLAVSADQRHPALPDVPTAIEAGVPGFEYYNWTGLYAPAKTPTVVVDQLAALVKRIADEPETLAFLARIGGNSFFAGPQELLSYQIAETERWKKTAARAGIQPE
jgi:tripartite-type tricarboxylate transporter receptor subunit TctC